MFSEMVIIGLLNVVSDRDRSLFGICLVVIVAAVIALLLVVCCRKRSEKKCAAVPVRQSDSVRADITFPLTGGGSTLGDVGGDFKIEFEITYVFFDDIEL